LTEQKTRWSTVRITTALVEEVEHIMKTEKYQKYGFSGKSSFISYLIRKEIDNPE
jgi:hypothetical protein